MKTIYLFSIVIFSCSSFTSLAQNIGIGLTNPLRAKLELNGVVGNTSAIFGGEGAGVSLQRNNPAVGFNHYYNADDKYMANGYAAAQWFNAGTGTMYWDFWNAGIVNQTATGLTRSMVMKPGGLVGIGNVDPHGLLQFPNALFNRKVVLWETANNDHQYYGFGIEGGTLRYAVDAPAAAHRFYAANNGSSSSLLMTIGGNKKVVIGTQDGTAKLGINSGDPQYSMEIVQTGNTGLALISPIHNYDYWELKTWNGFAGNSASFNLWYNNNQKAYIHYTDGTYFKVSDQRLKTNIHSLLPTLDKLMKITPASYEMKMDNPGHQASIGFIAQEIKEIFPELVRVNEGKAGYGIDNLHLIDYSGFTVLAIKAIQEQQQVIQHQQKQIDELKKLVQEIIDKQ